MVDRLAEHEYHVGRFYLRYGVPGAAASRIEGLLKNYPTYSGKDAALFTWASPTADQARPEDAQATFARLREEHPESRYIRKIPEKG